MTAAAVDTFGAVCSAGRVCAACRRVRGPIPAPFSHVARHIVETGSVRQSGFYFVRFIVADVVIPRVASDMVFIVRARPLIPKRLVLGSPFPLGFGR